MKFITKLAYYLIICVCVYGCSWEVGKALRGIIEQKKTIVEGQPYLYKGFGSDRLTKAGRRTKRSAAAPGP